MKNKLKEYLRNCLESDDSLLPLPTFKAKGIVAEWLGSALQKLLQRFESARYLEVIVPLFNPAGFF